MIKYIEEIYSCELDCTEDGVAYIYGADEQNVMDAKMLVEVRKEESSVYLLRL